MNDPPGAAAYDARIATLVPYYGCFHREIMDLVGTVRPRPARWLDTGGGTGSLVAAALSAFPDTRFLLYPARSFDRAGAPPSPHPVFRPGGGPDWPIRPGPCWPRPRTNWPGRPGRWSSWKAPPRI